MAKICCYQPSSKEHIANIITHAIPVIPSFYWFLELKELSKKEKIYIYIYGISLIMTFVISSLFHYFSYLGKNDKLRSIFHLCDRTIIYIFIAASYSPWLSVPKATSLSYMNWCIWIVALSGILGQFCLDDKILHQYELALYLMVGVIPAIIIAFYHVNSPGLSRFVQGGLAYISGIYFFKSDGLIPFAHAIWHLFVVAGVTFHYQALYQFLTAGHHHF